MKKYFYFILVLILIIGTTLFLYPDNPLEKYGVGYRVTGAHSPTYTYVQLYRIVDGVERLGPEVSAYTFKVRYEDLNGDDIPDIIVYRDSAPSVQVRILFFPDRQEGKDFEIIETNGLLVNYPAQGYNWP